MRLDELPRPSDDRSDWPWSVTVSQRARNPASGASWPKVSIVTPSYNQGAFIEETIRSVLLQGYPNLEYIVIDGGSTDGSVEIIEKYAPWLAHWVSEPDRGQSNAINKGLSRSTGEIWAYLNSDDRYEKGTLAKVAQQFVNTPGLQWLTGYARYVDENGKELEPLIPRPFDNLADTLIRWRGPRTVAIQVSNFMSREVLTKYGQFDESLHFSMDFEFGLRLLADGVVPVIVPEILAQARLHESSKTVANKDSRAFLAEDLLIVDQFLNRLSGQDKVRVAREVQAQMYYSELAGLRSQFEERDIRAFIFNLARTGWRHPSYLFRRPTLGLLRKLLVAK